MGTRVPFLDAPESPTLVPKSLGEVGLSVVGLVWVSSDVAAPSPNVTGVPRPLGTDGQRTIRTDPRADVWYS